MPSKKPGDLAREIAKLKAQTLSEIAKEKLAEEGPAEPMDEATFRFWCKAHPKWARLFNAIVERWSYSNGKLPDMPGKWAVYPLKEWAKSTGLSERTVDRGLAALEAEGLIERRRKPFGGRPLLAYLRPTVLGLTLARKSELVARLGKSASAPFSGPFGATVGATVGATFGATVGATDQTKNTSATKIHSYKDGDALTGIATEPGNKQELSGKIEEKKQGGHGSAAEAWEHAMAKHHPGTFVKLLPVDRKKLADLAKACPQDRATDVIECIVADWIGFIGHCKTHAGAFKTPASPSIDFALKFRAAAANYWLAKSGLVVVDELVVAKPKPAGKVKAYTKASTSPPEPEEPKVSLEEVWASLAETTH